MPSLMQETAFKIERGVPLTNASPHAGRKAKYPWRSLEVGDSFLVPQDFPSLCSSITRTEQRLGIKLASRKEGAGRRFFRIA